MNDPEYDNATTEQLHELLEEFEQMVQRDQRLSMEDFIKRHPSHSLRLRKVLPIAQLIAGMSASCATVSPEAQDHDLPKELGDFRLVRKIGRGGMGVVYEAQQLSLDRRVAVKVLPFAALLDPRQLERFRIEARAAGMLNHPNIVQVFSVGCERGVHYYAMEFVEGQTLADVCCRVKRCDESNRASGSSQILDWSESIGDSHDTTPLAQLSTRKANEWIGFCRQIATIGMNVAEALDYAHQRGIVHRDNQAVKPACRCIRKRSHRRLWTSKNRRRGGCDRNRRCRRHASIYVPRTIGWSPCGGSSL